MSRSAASGFGEVRVAHDAAHPWLLPSTAEMVALDRAEIAKGTSGAELMERAGRAIALKIIELYPDKKKISVLCGAGNNGGDGLVIARELRRAGIDTLAIVVGSSRYSVECEARLKADGEALVLVDAQDELAPVALNHKRVSLDDLNSVIARSELIVDALLGTGQREAPKGIVGKVVGVLASNANVTVVAVDIPTGVNGDTGAVYSPHVTADLTVAVQYVKRGMLLFPARVACGEIAVVAIGIDGGAPVEFSLVDGSNLPLIEPRLGDTHKGLLGRVLVIGGSLGMPGAPYLAALGALRAGAGIVSRVAPVSWSTVVPLPETILELIAGSGDAYGASDVAAVGDILERYDVVVLGPGLSAESSTGDFVAGVIEKAKSSGAKLIIDADALNLIAARAIQLTGLNAVVTPHPGEAGRLLGVSAAEVQSDRFAAARELEGILGVVVLLKGAGTVVYQAARGALIVEGSPFLAAPGSGDVLSGVIAGICSRTGSMFDAAVLGAFAHAKAGVAASTARGGTILASEIANYLPGW